MDDSESRCGGSGIQAEVTDTPLRVSTSFTLLDKMSYPLKSEYNCQLFASWYGLYKLNHIRGELLNGIGWTKVGKGEGFVLSKGIPLPVQTYRAGSGFCIQEGVAQFRII